MGRRGNSFRKRDGKIQSSKMWKNRLERTITSKATRMTGKPIVGKEKTNQNYTFVG